MVHLPNLGDFHDKNSELMSGGSTIHECAKSGDLRGVERLLRDKPSLLNKRICATLETPMHISAKHNGIKVMECLLDADGKVKLELEAKNNQCETPLHVAVMNGCEDAVRMLLQSGADIEARTNVQIHDSLHLAVAYAGGSGNNSTVKALLENSADLSAPDEVGLTPIDYLQENQLNSELVALLNQAGAKTCKQYDEQNKHDDGAKEEDYHRQKNWKGHACDYKNEKDTINESKDKDDARRSSKCNGKDDDTSYGTDDDRQRNITNYSSTSSDDDDDDDDDADDDDDVNKNDDSESKFDEFENELEKIVGLQKLKLQLRRWAKGAILDEKRRATRQDLGPRKRPHMAFLGNPGTGKTTVARILGKLLHSIGVMSTKTVTEVQRTDLVGRYIGDTGPKTRKKIEEAMGGILFVDEAYRLTTHVGTKDFGLEALEEIMSVLEDGDIVVIFTGYTEPMKRLLASNPRLYRRVTHLLEFEDFSCKDLAKMLMLKMSKQDTSSRLYGFKLDESCDRKSVLGLIKNGSSKEMRARMNGGLVDHMLNNARENLDSRLSLTCEGDELFTITLGDLEAGLRFLSERTQVDSSYACVDF